MPYYFFKIMTSCLFFFQFLCSLVSLTSSFFNVELNGKSSVLLLFLAPSLAARLPQDDQATYISTGSSRRRDEQLTEN